MVSNARKMVPVFFLMLGFVLGLIFSPRIAVLLTIKTSTPVPIPHYIPQVITKEGNWSSVLTARYNPPTIGNRSQSLLTLFTTWPNWSWKRHVFNNTLYNWKLLFPLNVTAVLFTNNLTVAQSAWDLNWTVLPIKNALPGDEGPPILPAMFKQVRETIASEMYGFVNGDILFDESILATVRAVLNSNLLTTRNSPPIMITGRRTNVKNITSTDALSWDSLRKRSKTGKPFMYLSEDYFITNRDYPWEYYPPIAVGQRAYDNWLVVRANQLSHTLVDGSLSILAAHQDAKKDSGTRKLKPFYNYNAHLLEKTFGPINYMAGQTRCSQFEAVRNMSGSIVIQRRVQLLRVCVVRKDKLKKHP